MKNPNCDNDKCTTAHGQIRVLPVGEDSNALLCKACYEHEIAFRLERNKELEPQNQFKLPKWPDLRIYLDAA